jgi:hypothetical protein
MSREQREHIRQLRASSPLDLGGEVHEERALFEQLLSQHPLPADVTVTELDTTGFRSSQSSSPTYPATAPPVPPRRGVRAGIGAKLTGHGHRTLPADHAPT